MAHLVPFKLLSVVSLQQDLSGLAPSSFPPLRLPSVSGFHHVGPAAGDARQRERFTQESPRRLCSPIADPDPCNSWEAPPTSERFPTVATNHSRNQGDDRPKEERLVLPPLLPVKEGNRRRGDHARRQNFEKVTLEPRGAERERRLHAERGPQVAVEHEEGLCPRLWRRFCLGICGFCSNVLCSPEAPVPVGLPGCAVGGQKGTGRQCSLAFLQDPKDPDRGPTKGLLPLELRGNQGTFN